MVLSLDIEVLRATCVGCGQPFVPANARQTRCKHDCGRTTHNSARSAERLRHDTTFIGVDGEGVGRGTRHAYCLLSIGSESLYHTDSSQLHVLEIFDFLWAQFLKEKSAAYVGFYLGYDFTQWLRTLPGERARMLLTREGRAKRMRRTSGGNPTPFPVRWQGWEFDMLNYKRFKLRKEGEAEWMYVCDAGPFFQMSFLKAITKDWKHPIVTPENLAVIKEGKERRGFAKFDAEMIHYNVTENKVMSALMAEYNRGLVASGIKLRNNQWFGPGQAAQEWLNNISAPTAEIIHEKTPFAYRDTARKSYYGGWFEITAHGPIPGITHEYDINSAYPAIIATLPCLLHGQYTSGSDPITFKSSTYTLVHVSAESTSQWLAGLPYRRPTGEILRPSLVEGWYWHHEVEAAKRAKLIKSYQFIPDQDGLCWYRYVPCKCAPPLRSIRDLYNQRLEVGKDTPQGKALKLVYNSAYGKQAQSAGTPKYGNAVYASLITAGCRVKILEAIATHKKGVSDVVMIATDGIYFRSEHDKLKLSETELGAWSYSEKHNLSLFMPGVYWDDGSRERLRNGGTPELKSRGVNSSDLAQLILRIDSQWAWKPTRIHRVGEVRVEVPFSWPSLDIPITFNMVSATQALARGAWETAGTVIDDDIKHLSADPRVKRNADTLKLHGDILRTRPYDMVFPVESTPYEARFGDEMRETLDAAEMISPEGDPLIFAIRELNGL